LEQHLFILLDVQQREMSVSTCSRESLTWNQENTSGKRYSLHVKTDASGDFADEL